jgi:hypothetical protein
LKNFERARARGVFLGLLAAFAREKREVADLPPVKYGFFTYFGELSVNGFYPALFGYFNRK